MEDHGKTIRLYVDQPLAHLGQIELGGPSHHYLRNVMRLEVGASLRLFNGRDGEWLARIDGIDKKSAMVGLEKRLRHQPAAPRRIHLLFPPLKKERLDFLIEKAVELGATDLHPLISQNSEVRKINDERVRAQIIEAAEQCERLDLPALHECNDIFKILSGFDKIYAAIERVEAPLSTSQPGHSKTNELVILIGPPGGFTAEEKARLAAMPSVTPVSLGANILRAETAAIAALALFGI